MIKLTLKSLSWQVNTANILNDIDLTFAQGELVALLGPNGAGKSSLIRCALDSQDGYSGSVDLDGKAVSQLSPEQKAKLVAYLPQSRPMAWPLTVVDTVSLGRFCHGVQLGKLGAADEKYVTQAIADCDLAHLRNRSVNTLSGGELARVHCARAFAAGAPLLIADEPIAALDPKHQYNILSLIRAYVDAGNGAMIVLHDVALAAKFADRFVWMKDGAIIEDGTPDETLTRDRMREVYEVESTISDLGAHKTVSITGTI